MFPGTYDCDRFDGCNGRNLSDPFHCRGLLFLLYARLFRIYGNEKFGGTPFVGMAIGAALVYPSIAVIMGGEPLYTLFAGTIFESPVYVTFLGIPVILMNYASSVIPVVLVCFFAAKLERFLDRCIPQLVKAFVVPMLTILGGVVLGLLVLGPIATFASNLLGALMGFLLKLTLQSVDFFMEH